MFWKNIKYVLTIIFVFRTQSSLTIQVYILLSFIEYTLYNKYIFLFLASNNLYAILGHVTNVNIYISIFITYLSIKAR